MSDQSETDTDDHQNSEQPDSNTNIEQRWQKLKTTYNETALKVLGRRKKKCQSWISTDSWKNIEERKKLKKKIDDARSERLKNKAQEEYREKDKEVKRSLRKDKRDWANSIAQEAADAASQCQMKGVYDATSTGESATKDQGNWRMDRWRGRTIFHVKLKRRRPTWRPSE